MTDRSNIIPKPYKIEQLNGNFVINKQTLLLLNEFNQKIKKAAEIFADQINSLTGYEIDINEFEEKKNVKDPILINFPSDSGDSIDGEYLLVISSNKIELTSGNYAGIFYGFQTLLQIIYQVVFKNENYKTAGLNIPCCKIEDSPRFGWRGLMLDSARTFLTKDFIKQYVDLLSFYKMNILHWHLTDDQGWRIEIKRYPLLTDAGAWRTEEEGTINGGFYTQGDIKEIVDYAEARCVTIIPEIEMPGHSTAALAAYPEYSCEGKLLEVGTLWGIYKDIFCAGKESIFDFIKNILDEVIELFPGKYIHIGGDEVPKDRWNECPLCNERIRNEKLESIKDLHKYFLKRIKDYLAENNRKAILWDDFEEYGIIDDAIVQSWQGFKPAVEAAKSQNYAVVSPMEYSYFDYDLSLIDLNKVYEFNPVSPELPAEFSKFILGGECNMWSERVSQDQIDKKVFPRLFAMSEVLWTLNSQKSFLDFYDRVRTHFKILEFLGIECSPGSKPVKIKPEPETSIKSFKIIIECKYDFLEVFYTLDGSKPSVDSKKYTSGFNVDSSCLIRAAAFYKGVMFGEEESKSIIFHKGFGTKIRLLNSSSEKYPGTGINNLVDGLTGSVNFNDRYWQGFEGDDLLAIIELDKAIALRKISINFLQDLHSRIFLPNEVHVEYSLNGVEYFKINIQQHIVSLKKQLPFIYKFSSNLFNINARYVKVFARNISLCPEWHPDARQKAWLFADEIIIE